MNRIQWMALNLTGCGISVIPLANNSKRPAGQWEQYQYRLASRSEIGSWRAGNLGIVTGAISGVVVVDCESEENANWFMKYRSAGLRPAMVRTPRGVHLYYQHPGQEIKNTTHVRDSQGISRYDIRADGGYVVTAPSVVDGKGYSWLREFFDSAQLPMFQQEWRPAQTETQQRSTIQNPGLSTTQPAMTRERTVTSGEAYIMKIQAISGQGGHNATWRAVCRLRDSGLTEAEAFAIMRSWNITNSDPPWSEPELLHKVKDVFSK